MSTVEDTTKPICKECEDSERPGRIYKHNDVESGMFVNCVCNPDGDLSPDFPEDRHDR